MDPWTTFPNADLTSAGAVGNHFLELGITTFHGACEYIHRLPYGYNSDRDDVMILFKEQMGTCTTKHAVAATLAVELGLAVVKHVGIYAMTEAVVTGTEAILARFELPYVPMAHCFLVDQAHQVDLTEGNRNGKNCAIDHFLFTARVSPTISAKEEYLLYREALTRHILLLPEMNRVPIKRVLHAREAGLSLLKSNIA